MGFLRVRFFVAMGLFSFFSSLFPGVITKKVCASHPSAAEKIPVIFHPSYDISFCGLEKLHPFDSKKYGKVHAFLVDTLSEHLKTSHANVEKMFYTPAIVSDADLAKIHTARYLASLKKSAVVATISELSLLAWVPNWFVQRWLLTPMKYATGGTVLAAELALEKGYAINLSGGYHHAKADSGDGFCVYADIPLAVYKLHEKRPNLKILIVDLDAHQGNGNESIFGDDDRVAIYDMYNQDIYPHDSRARQFIDFDYPIHSGIKDDAYLALLQKTLPQAFDACKPDLVIYNAGTDIYEQDPLGHLCVSENGIIKRDEFVFAQAKQRNVPIAMVLSGGYTKQGTGVISKSISNVLEKFILPGCTTYK